MEFKLHMNKPNLSLLLSCPLYSFFLHSNNLSIPLLWMQFIQSVSQATQADWGASVPGWTQETFILLFSLGTMCWSWEAALLHRPLLLCTQAQQSPALTDTMWTFTSVAHCSGAQMHKTTKLQSSSCYKTARTWKEETRTPSLAQVCQRGGFVQQHLFLMLL